RRRPGIAHRCGYWCEAHLVRLAATLDPPSATLGGVVVTHCHTHHAKGAPTIAAAHERARLFQVPSPDDTRFSVQWQSPSDGDPITVGDQSLTVLYTPGHAPDHVALWHEESGTVFTGDLVVRGGSVLIPASRGGDLVQYLASLERIR